MRSTRLRLHVRARNACVCVCVKERKRERKIGIVTCAPQHTLHRVCVYVRIPNVKEGFAEEEYGNACVVCTYVYVCVCTKDGGAGRKRGGDSVCEKKYTHTHNIAYKIK